MSKKRYNRRKETTGEASTLAQFMRLAFVGCALIACGSNDLPTPDVVATAVAATLTAVATTQVATSTPAPATQANLPPTPTQIVIDDLPVDGENGNLSLRGERATKEGRYVLLPQIPHDQVITPMVFRGQLALRIEVLDPQRGEQDGAGIHDVTFSIIDNETNDVVYQNQEMSTPYCLFGSDEPLCSRLIFAQTNFRWPNEQPLYNGNYTAQIVIQPQSGDNATWNFNFSIAGAKQRPATTSELFAQIVQTGTRNTATEITDALVFQVEAYNQDVGNHDGDGIDHVDMDIYNPDGKRVYHRTETTAHYCAFGGGEPDCTVFSFDDNYYRWPNNGPQITNGQLRLVATVHAKDGRSQTVETRVEIQGVP